MFERILVCLDGSKLAEQILPYAAEQAIRFNSKLILIHAFNIPATVAGAMAQAAPRVDKDLIQEETERLGAEAQSYLEGVATLLRQKGLPVDCVALQGTAGDIIVSYAQNELVGLIALATHGHSGLGRAIFGSVADYVLRESGLPILVIKPQ
jgi:nucleotide-binding universal stress UspA family protein